MSRADRVRIVGPLSQHLRAVERSLLARGYSRNSVNNRLGFTAQLSFWMHVQAVAPGALTELHLQAFVRGRRRVAPAFSRGYLGCVVKSLVEIGAISSPRPLPVPAPSRLDRTLEPFATYLRDERALKSASNQYVGIVRQFLVHRFGSQVPRLERITAHDLTEFVLREFRRSRVGSVKYSVTALRSYFRFLYVSGAIKQDLTGAIPAIAGWRLLGIPKGITPEHLSKILAAPDRRTRIGRRNLAILLLLSRLGLRRHEVASIALEDIDWRLGELRIRGKGDKHERLPLPREVGAALADHLQNQGRGKWGRERSRHSRKVFLGVRTPFRPLTPPGISGVVLKCSLQAGVPPVSAHRLRHTVATQILRQGGSLDEVAQLLRHSSHDTTAIYAKVDFVALRAVVQPWPCAMTRRSS